MSEKECRAIMYAVKSFRHYLLWKHFSIFTEHYHLTFLRSQRIDSLDLLGRWKLLLQNYDFAIECIKG